MADGWARYGYAAGPAAGAGGAAASPAVRPPVAVVEAQESGGQLTARLTGPSAGAAWLVRRIPVSTPGRTARVREYVYVGEPAPETLVMGTNAGNLDVAVEDPPLFVPDSTALCIQWDTGPTRALARVEYQEI